MDEEGFRDAVSRVNVPVLVLDQKWHRLFALTGKPAEVQLQEQIVRDILSKQGQLNSDLIKLKRVKADLMSNIVQNMDDSAEGPQDTDKAMSNDTRLINEANEKIAEIEDELLELPRELQKENKKLMLLTMSFCYSRIRINQEEEEKISQWIDEFRVELKKNIIRKQNRIINNKEIYSYMHDVFGRDVMTLFDVRYEDIQGGEGRMVMTPPKDENQKIMKAEGEKPSDLKDPELLPSHEEQTDRPMENFSTKENN